ncbi:MAG: polyphenol oxidase family protein [Raoultibacter sp.]
MKTTLELPLPHVSEGRFASVSALTDEKLFEIMGIRIAFTERSGGTSEGGFSSLNLANHVGDDTQAVAVNRALVCEAFDIAVDKLIVPSQVHGDHLVLVSDAREGFNRACEEAFAGADALVVEAPDVAALLCYADCVPVIVVSPTGRFAVVHAGWRGVENEIAVHAVRKLSELDAADGFSQTKEGMNVYIGPYIHSECFETGADVYDKIRQRMCN